MLHAMADTDPAPTSPITSATTRAHRAEDDTSGGGGRMLARLVSPFLAVIPWLLTMGGLWMLARSARTQAEQFETAWGQVVGAVVLFVLAALVWAALTAWSSVGTTLAGVASLAFGIALSSVSVAREIYTAFPSGMGNEVWYFVTPMNFLLMGSLLIGGGLGAAGARHLGHR